MATSWLLGPTLQQWRQPNAVMTLSFFVLTADVTFLALLVSLAGFLLPPWPLDRNEIVLMARVRVSK